MRRRKINFGPGAPLGDARGVPYFVLKILAGVELDVGSFDELVICLVFFFSILVNDLSFFRRLVVSELRYWILLFFRVILFSLLLVVFVFL
jgi:hypothetical protein